MIENPTANWYKHVARSTYSTFLIDLWNFIDHRCCDRCCCTWNKSLDIRDNSSKQWFNDWSSFQCKCSTLEYFTGTDASSTFAFVFFRWKGLFSNCSRFDTTQCDRYFRATTFFLCLFGLIVLLISGICSILEMIRTSDRRFFIPMLFFVSCVLMTAGLFDYGSFSRLNSHSSRAMITSVVFGYAALPISAFVAGRYSAYDRYINNGQKYVPAATNGN